MVQGSLQLAESWMGKEGKTVLQEFFFHPSWKAKEIMEYNNQLCLIKSKGTAR